MWTRQNIVYSKVEQFNKIQLYYKYNIEIRCTACKLNQIFQCLMHCHFTFDLDNSNITFGVYCKCDLGRLNLRYCNTAIRFFLCIPKICFAFARIVFMVSTTSQTNWQHIISLHTNIPPIDTLGYLKEGWEVGLLLIYLLFGQDSKD